MASATPIEQRCDTAVAPSGRFMRDASVGQGFWRGGAGTLRFWGVAAKIDMLTNRVFEKETIALEPFAGIVLRVHGLILSLATIIFQN